MEVGKGLVQGFGRNEDVVGIKAHQEYLFRREIVNDVSAASIVVLTQVKNGKIAIGRCENPVATSSHGAATVAAKGTGALGGETVFGALSVTEQNGSCSKRKSGQHYRAREMAG